MPEKMKFQRILLKLSGEALMGVEDYGIDPKVLVTVLGARPVQCATGGAVVPQGPSRSQR
jgi:uridylate kinase